MVYEEIIYEGFKNAFKKMLRDSSIIMLLGNDIKTLLKYKPVSLENIYHTLQIQQTRNVSKDHHAQKMLWKGIFCWCKPNLLEHVLLLLFFSIEAICLNPLTFTFTKLNNMFVIHISTCFVDKWSLNMNNITCTLHIYW